LHRRHYKERSESVGPPDPQLNATRKGLYLHDSVLDLLGNRATGPPPLTTAADAESLRLLLAEEDPRLHKVYYGRPPAA